MKRIRIKVIGTGKPGDPFKPDLPTYIMIPGSEEYDGVDKKVLKTIEVLIPADECNGDGQPDPVKIRRKYKGQPAWDRDGVAADVLAAGPQNAPQIARGPDEVAEAPRATPAPGLLDKIKALFSRSKKKEGA